MQLLKLVVHYVVVIVLSTNDLAAFPDSKSRAVTVNDAFLLDLLLFIHSFAIRCERELLAYAISEFIYRLTCHCSEFIDFTLR